MIGPDNKYFRGEPLSPDDRGGLYAGFTISKRLRIGVMEFGTVVNMLSATPPEARAMAERMRSAVHSNFGKLPYDASTLPLKVWANKSNQMIEIRLPQATGVLAANPEMWLALAERLEAAANELPDA